MKPDAAHRSEFAAAFGGERLVHIAVLALALASAIVLFSGEAANPERSLVLLTGGIVVLALVPLVPNRRWRMVLAVASWALMLGSFVAG
jgi:hypothetical protein